MNEVMKSMLNHRSIRRYKNESVDDKILDQIILAVQQAPNWVNLQHVSVIVVKDPEQKKKFSKLCGYQKHVEQAPVFLIFCADFYRTQLACKKHGSSFEQAASLLDTLIVGANEVGIALGTAVTAAESFGLGTVPIGDIRLHPMEVIKELDLPEYVIPMLGLCIGYPDENPGLKPRLPKEAVCFSEQYNPNLENLLNQYDKLYSDYLEYRPGNSRVGNWTEMNADFYTPDYNHYPELPEMLNHQGFLKSQKVNHH